MSALADHGAPATSLRGETLRVRGLVQGVGFRPQVWRLASELGLRGEVRNDADGVLVRVWGERTALDRFATALAQTPPPLARVDAIERAPLAEPCRHDAFAIVASAPGAPGAPSTGIVPDAAACAACVAETLDASSRRYRYPFTNCTHCGPRLSIVEAIPYDRAGTSMRGFVPCGHCAREYHDPADRRFHAQPIACHACGPRVWLARADGRAFRRDRLSRLDDVDAAAVLIRRGEIVAVKGVGGFHLACDAGDAAAVRRLRQRKARPGKPFALMARDLDVVRRYCAVSPAEAALLASPAAPVVLLEADGAERVCDEVAPAQRTLGFMLPYTPLHHLLLQRLERPLVMTSGNRSEEPQCIDNDEAMERLPGIADWLLLHDRPIVSRLDDSVTRVVAGEARVLRAARGHAPLRLPLPRGAAPVLAMGGELKSSFCLAAGGTATLSQHLGDLEDARTLDDYERSLALYRRLFRHRAGLVVVDAHPGYLSARLGRELARGEGARLLAVQHHHAHVAACLAENGVPPEAPPVLGVVLDGLGYGSDGELWGGEFLLADYRGFERLATFKPVALPGGEQAVREPWRSTYAHLAAAMGWARFRRDFRELPLARFLTERPRARLDAIIRDGRYAPRASSCGRLFDAVAAALGICPEQVSYEGEAAVLLEAAVDRRALVDEQEALAYPFAIARPPAGRLTCLEPLAMWQALLDDLVRGTPTATIAARFHRGLARGIADMVRRLAAGGDEAGRFDTVALSGGVFQNRILLELLLPQLRTLELEVLTHRRVPPNDGGIALGQAAIGAVAGTA